MRDEPGSDNMDCHAGGKDGKVSKLVIRTKVRAIVEWNSTAT
jgi:hypothetical protein